MGVGRINQLSLLEQVQKLADLESDVLSDAVGGVLPLAEVLEDGAEGCLVFLEHGLCHFELFLKWNGKS